MRDTANIRVRSKVFKRGWCSTDCNLAFLLFGCRQLSINFPSLSVCPSINENCWEQLKPNCSIEPSVPGFYCLGPVENCRSVTSEHDRSYGSQSGVERCYAQQTSIYTCIFIVGACIVRFCGHRCLDGIKRRWNFIRWQNAYAAGSRIYSAKLISVLYDH